MNIGYSIIHIQHPLHNNTSQQYYKLTFPTNSQSLLHRWDPPCIKANQLLLSNPQHYFTQCSSRSSSLNKYWCLQSSQEITKKLITTTTLRALDFKFNYAYNVYALDLHAVFEARIITCFHKQCHDSKNVVYWDLFIDHLNTHLYVNTDVLCALMQSTYNWTILGFNLSSLSLASMISCPSIDIFYPRKLTTFITLNKATLDDKFQYDNNVLVLKGPQLISNKLIFDEDPLHIGSSIVLSQQNASFERETNDNILKLHYKKKKRRLTKGRMIIVCDKHDLDTAVNFTSSKLHINYVSISDITKDEEEFQSTYITDTTTNRHIHDDYVILLLATNSRYSLTSNNYTPFDSETINFIQQSRRPNMSSNNGEKHNSSYGKYYGFGIINKYRIVNGISFGRFEGKKKNNKYIERQIINNLIDQFSMIINKLEIIFKDVVEIGNNQINSLIHLCGRRS